ncbi:putative membrane protein [Lysinibacillus sp. RC46]
MMFWKSKHVDERIKNQQNKIYKEIFFFVIVICLISILIKFITQGVTSQNVVTERLIILFSVVYYCGRAAYLGIFTEEVEIHDSASKFKLSTKLIIFGVAIGMVIAIIMGVNSAFNYAESTSQAIYFFFMVFFVSLFMYSLFIAGILFLFYVLAKKKSDRVIQRMLEDEDSGDQCEKHTLKNGSN